MSMDYLCYLAHKKNILNQKRLRLYKKKMRLSYKVDGVMQCSKEFVHDRKQRRAIQCEIHDVWMKIYDFQDEIAELAATIKPIRVALELSFKYTGANSIVAISDSKTKEYRITGKHEIKRRHDSYIFENIVLKGEKHV